MTYRIKTAVRLTGIPRNTLLAWERRYVVYRPAVPTTAIVCTAMATSHASMPSGN